MVTDSSTSVGNLAMGAPYLYPPVWSRARDRPEPALSHPPRLTSLRSGDARYTTALARDEDTWAAPTSASRARLPPVVSRTSVGRYERAHAITLGLTSARSLG